MMAAARCNELQQWFASALLHFARGCVAARNAPDHRTALIGPCSITIPGKRNLAGGPTALASGTTCRDGITHPRPGIFSSRAARGLTAITSLLDFRAGAFLLPCARPVLFGAVLMLSAPALAGGLDEVAADVDPCPALTIVNDGSMTAAIFAQFVAVRQMSCPGSTPDRRRFFDARTGDELSDAEILVRIFNGSKVAPVSYGIIPQPAVVSLPGALWAMLVALLLLVPLRRRRST